MAKATKKKVKKTTKKKVKKSPARQKKEEIKRIEIKIEKEVAKNFVSLQKVMVDFSEKMELLSDNLENLLKIFEESAKSLAKRDIESPKGHQDTKKIMEKLDKVSQQTALVGKGLELIHQMASEKNQGGQNMPMAPSSPPQRPPEDFQMQRPQGTGPSGAGRPNIP